MKLNKKLSGVIIAFVLTIGVSTGAYASDDLRTTISNYFISLIAKYDEQISTELEKARTDALKAVEDKTNEILTSADGYMKSLVDQAKADGIREIEAYRDAKVKELHDARQQAIYDADAKVREKVNGKVTNAKKDIDNAVQNAIKQIEGS